MRQPDVVGSTRCYFAMLEMRFPKTGPFVDMRPWLHHTPVTICLSLLSRIQKVADIAGARLQVQVSEQTPMFRIYNMFKRLGLRYVLVVCSNWSDVVCTLCSLPVWLG